jgi:predicted transcriptional regulator of viral defense system
LVVTPLLGALALGYGTASVAKRIGFALERAGVKTSLLDPLLHPSKPARGTRDARWGLRVNLAAKRAS